MKERTHIISIHLLLLLVSSFLLIGVYHWLVNNINTERAHVALVNWELENDLAAINNLQMKNPRLITPSVIANNDKLYGTDIYSEMVSESGTPSSAFLKAHPEAVFSVRIQEKKLATIKELTQVKAINVLNYLPPLPLLLIIILLLFIVRVVSHLGDFISDVCVDWVHNRNV